MPGADEVDNRRERDKLTIAEVCADLGISRRTFHEWRIRRSEYLLAARPLARQAMTTD